MSSRCPAQPAVHYTILKKSDCSHVLLFQFVIPHLENDHTVFDTVFDRGRRVQELLELLSAFLLKESTGAYVAVSWYILRPGCFDISFLFRVNISED